MNEPRCPEAGRLKSLVQGELSETSAELLSRHVEGCADCEAHLRHLERGSSALVAELREAVASEPVTVPSALLQRLQELASKREGLAPGQYVGRFELLEELGAGSFARVFRAWDPEQERLVALKVPRPGTLVSAADAERFLREARSAARLHHPGLVALYEIGQRDDGGCFLVEEYIEGVTLAQRLRQGAIETREAMALLHQVAVALHYAHENGIVHRDLKPANILLASPVAPRPEEGGPGVPRGADATPLAVPRGADATPLAKVADFGLAKGDAEDSLTLEGQVLGTPAYMSPEQAHGESHHVDARSDVYSIGVILYEMLTGERPFRGTRRMLLLQVLYDEPRPPRLLNDRIPRDLEIVCLKCLEKQPARRYASAAALADDLRRVQNGEPVKARPPGRLERLRRWGRRHPLIASLFLAVALGSAFGLVHLSRLSRELVHSSALESAAQQAEVLEIINDRYSSEIVDRLAGQKVRLLPNYRHHAGAIPLPATFTIDLGEQLAQRHDGAVQVRLYSDLPFKTRSDGGPRDAFEVEALRQLRLQPEQPWYRFEDFQGKPVLRYAVARRMTSACLRCHNYHPDSPRKDWKEGDVRGVLEIIRPLARDEERIRAGLQGTFTTMAAVSAVLLGTGLVAVAVQRRRTRFRDAGVTPPRSGER